MDRRERKTEILSFPNYKFIVFNCTMTANAIAMKYLSRVFKNISSTKVHVYPRSAKTVFSLRPVLPYSTVVPKQFFSMLDVFTDIFYIKSSNDMVRLEPINVIECVEKNQTETHTIDKLIGSIDISNMQTMVKILINELQAKIKLKDWNGVDRILVFFVDKKVALNHPTILDLAKEFCNAGFVDGLKSLLSLTDATKDEHTTRGEVLHYLAMCNWRIGNVEECLKILRDCCVNHADNTDLIKKSLRIIIYQSVTSRSEAVLFNVSRFVHEFTKDYQDYYLITVLWNDLFMSEWYSDHQLADTLLLQYEYLRTSVGMMASTLARNFIKKNRFEDTHRLLEILLKHKMMQPYATITQMLFDYHCMRGDKLRCSEIIKASIHLQIPLREEQYNSFISWSVSGNPYKFIKPIERFRSGT